jgi:hypothetical protein
MQDTELRKGIKRLDEVKRFIGVWFLHFGMYEVRMCKFFVVLCSESKCSYSQQMTDKTD